MSILSRLWRPDVRKLGARKNIKDLIKALGHKDAGIHQEALVILSKIGDPTFVKPFVSILQNLYTTFKREEHKIAKEFHIDFLLDMVKVLREKYEQDRAKPLWALKTIGDSTSIEPFVKEVRKAIREIEREGPQWKRIRRTHEQWNRIRERRHRPIWALENIGKSAVSQIIEIAKSKDEYKHVRVRMISVLGLRKDATAVESLIQIALDERDDPMVREDAVKSLKWFEKDPRIIEPLRRLTKVGNNSLQKEAEDALKRVQRLQR